MGDFLEGMAELRPGPPHARSRALDLLLKEAARMFNPHQGNHEGTPKRLSPTSFKGAARKARGARRVARRAPKKAELESPAEDDDAVSSSPSSPTSSASASSATGCTDSDTASYLRSPTDSPIHADDTATSSPAAFTLSPESESDATSSDDAAVDKEQPSTTEGEPRSTGLPQRHDTRPPSSPPAPHVLPSVGHEQSDSTDSEKPAAAVDGQASAETERAKSSPPAPASSPSEPSKEERERVHLPPHGHAAPAPTSLAQEVSPSQAAPVTPQPPLASPALVSDDSPGGSGPQESRDTHENEASSPRAPSLPEPRLSPLSGAASQEKKKKKKGKNKGTLRNREQPIASADDLADHPKPSEPPACGGVQGDHPTGPRREKRLRFVPFVAPLQPQVTDDDLPPREYTVLYRPVARRSHFLAASGDAIAAFLSGVPGAHRVRPNLRRNVVAVDTLPGEDLTALLAVRVICDVRVRAKALILNTCTGTLFDVDPTFDGATIFEGLESSVPVVAIARSGDVVTLRFAGDVVPEEVLLFRRRRAVRPRLPRPLQCGRCGLFGHATVTCSRDPRCLQCAGGHPTNSCTVDRRRCLHCGGPHAATEPRCPQWQLERRVAATLASSKPRITRKQALELARSSGTAVIDSSKQRPAGQRATESRPLSSRRQPGLSYSAALTGGTQADSSISGRVGEPPVTDNNPVQPPGATAPDTSVLVLTALASALRSLLELAPADSPARHMCVAALAMHDALVQHG
ncbi:hypothetical protein HPB49_017960 [Dermacentor silvarum]|uniref:Uncharacterized protein n=1 Tax=Dermacentor silvarum TaxID=543639 RepID=A0ACB8DQ69_DERSI|nr:hypothetical protein HPB49_017960 [Dermacentor silvarum]